MSARSKTNHVIWDNSLPLFGEAPRGDQMRFRCLHCGDVFVLQLPCSLSMAGVVAKQYGKDHRRCKKPPEPPPEPEDC